MSRVKSPVTLEEKFVEIVSDILIANDYEIIHFESDTAEFRGDLLVREPDTHARMVVELKLYRSSRMDPFLIRRAAYQVDSIIQSGKASRGVIATTSPISERERDLITRSFKHILIWDQLELIEKAKHNRNLLAKLSEFLKDIQLGPYNDTETAAQFLEEISDPSPVRLGDALAVKLENSSAGRSKRAAEQFEKLCEESLKLMFARDFSGWKRQALIERGFHRMDLIARLVSNNAFWVMLATDFRCRYVTFEFKNYSSTVTQSEIFTTEKYLFTAALRSVAIIIARNGTNRNAERAINGALREQGKLILCLSLSEICGMLRGFDVGEDLCNVLSGMLDEMLISIGR